MNTDIMSICPKLTKFLDSVGQMVFRFLVANSFKVHFLHFELHLGDSYQKQRQ